MFETEIMQFDDWESYLETPPTFAEHPFSQHVQINDFHNDEYSFMLSKTIESPDFEIAPDGTSVVTPQNFVADSFRFEDYFNEIPTRSIQMANVPPTATIEDFTYVCKKFGDVEKIDNLQYGSVIVTFYSMESAQKMRVSHIMIRYKFVNLCFVPEEFDSSSKQPHNNGTIVIFHVPKNTTDETLHERFEKFGKIREIRHTPYKETQRFIEFYDIRSAEYALNTMNGKKLNPRNPHSKLAIEYSLPGEYKKNLMKFYRTSLPKITKCQRAL